MTSPGKEQGIGLIEVLIALAILVVTSLATSTLQVDGMKSARSSNMHFSLEQLSSDMIDTLRADAVTAATGAYNFDAGVEADLAETTDTSAAAARAESYAWNGRIVQLIPSGEGSVNCAADACDISISWLEEIDGNNHRLFYRARTPL